MAARPCDRAQASAMNRNKKFELHWPAGVLIFEPKNNFMKNMKQLQTLPTLRREPNVLSSR